MLNKIWVINSLGKDVLYRDKEKVDNYIKLAIESGSLVKLSYVNKEVQDFFKACAEGEVYTGDLKSEDVEDYIKDYQTSNKILFVNEKGYDERLLNFSNNSTDFVLKDEINTNENDWVDFGGVNIPKNKSNETVKKKKMKKEKTNSLGYLIALLPYMYFIVNYGRRFSSVLTIATISAIIILVYKLAKKQPNLLNIGVAGIFVIISILRLINPYWINSIAALFITLGMCAVFLLGEFMEEGILSFYYKTSLRAPKEYTKFTVLWIAVFMVILGNVIYFGGVSFGMSVGLMLIVWLMTSVNLKGCEVEVIDEDEQQREDMEINLNTENIEIEKVELNNSEEEKLSLNN